MWNEIKFLIEKHKKKTLFAVSALGVLNIFVFSQIFFLANPPKDTKIYFLDVGQGDSELVILPGGVKVLIDGGPMNGKLLEEVGKILPPADRYIDLLMMSHPQLDHFGGFIDLMKRYKIGAFLTNGREGTASAFADLEKTISEKNIRRVVLGKGDAIKYRESVFNILWPAPAHLLSKELNDTSIVMELKSNNSRTLFTADIGANIEAELIKFFKDKLDILKVGHHGSKFSSSKSFLAALKPEVAVIEVGKNSYGHPTKAAIDRVLASGAKIFRTDQNGTVEAVIDGKSIKFFEN